MSATLPDPPVIGEGMGLVRAPREGHSLASFEVTSSSRSPATSQVRRDCSTLRNKNSLTVGHDHCGHLRTTLTLSLLFMQ